MIPLRKKSEGAVTFVLMLLTAFCLLLTSCKKDNTSGDDSGSLTLSGISLPSTLTATRGAKITFTGKGFQAGDVFTFILTSGSEITCSTIATAVTETSVSFLLPEDLNSGTYKVIVSRGDNQLSLGSTIINITVNTNIPDVDGMTVKGVVYCNGEGVSGVVVSDGYEVTSTNEDGIYYLASEKENGYVFISVPGNYEVSTSGNMTQFYQSLSSSGSVVEQKNFSLIKTDNTNHVVLGMADWHLAKRNSDLNQLVATLIPDINTTIAEYEAEGYKVYGLTLGDLSWDLYWYSNSFSLGECVEYLNMLNCPVFNVTGNHDNDPYAITDWLAEIKFRLYIGPTYYSFNLGKVHYVVLDDIVWENTGGAEGTLGDRTYDNEVTQKQLDWLAKDLATITDKNTPVVVALHIPLFKIPSVDDNGNLEANKIYLDNGTAVLNLLSDFSNVHFLSGHTHQNYTVVNGNLIEHNTGAICGTWWWTNKPGYSGNHMGPDGSPGGYGVYKMTGTDIQWYYKGAGFSKDYQFRAYDLNTVYITAAKFAPNASEEDMAVYAGEYATKNSNNEVLVFVWNYDPEWKVEIIENGNSLSVKRVEVKDPLHIISYEAFRLNDGAIPTSAFVTSSTPNMFKATALSATSTINIKVTDRFGNIYTESMERPKEFSLSIQ